MCIPEGQHILNSLFFTFMFSPPEGATSSGEVPAVHIQPATPQHSILTGGSEANATRGLVSRDAADGEWRLVAQWFSNWPIQSASTINYMASICLYELGISMISLINIVWSLWKLSYKECAQFWDC